MGLISFLSTGNDIPHSVVSMTFVRPSWHLLLVTNCGLVNRRQHQIIAFQNAWILVQCLMRITPRSGYSSG